MNRLDCKRQLVPQKIWAEASWMMAWICESNVSAPRLYMIRKTHRIGPVSRKNKASETETEKELRQDKKLLKPCTLMCRVAWKNAT
mmetsp:Transcript_136047/g.290860  ORF Transcript_136047/g.290860 Transcript_136047/m.290860 type:complete len:86 (+) Transcript_136047:50-307(+)